MSSSVGIIIPNIWKVIKMFQTTNQFSHLEETHQLAICWALMRDEADWTQILVSKVSSLAKDLVSDIPSLRYPKFYRFRMSQKKMTHQIIDVYISQ